MPTRRIYFARDPDFAAGRCPSCGEPTLNRHLLYDVEAPPPPLPDRRTPLGFAYLHANPIPDCVTPPDLADALLERDRPRR